MRKLLVTVKELAEMAGVSTRQVWRAVKGQRLPRPTYNGKRAARWNYVDAKRWIARRKGQLVGCDAMKAIERALAPRPWQLPFVAPPKFMRIEDVVQTTGETERTLWRMVASGTFPKPQSMPLRPRLWLTTEVLDWMDEQRRLKR